MAIFRQLQSLCTGQVLRVNDKAGFRHDGFRKRVDGDCMGHVDHFRLAFPFFGV